MKVKVRANSNIALIKYWGKRNAKLNLSATGSVSVTLDALYTETSAGFSDSLSDIVLINGNEAAGKEYNRVSAYLDLFRNKYNYNQKYIIETVNNFPSGAGLASSASGFAALAASLSWLHKHKIKDEELSALARTGSGSAARSIFGGFVEMKTGQGPDSASDYAEMIAPPDYWDLSVLVLITDAGKKKTGSTEGMNHTAYSSPYYNSWISSSNSDIYEAKKAIQQKDFEKLADVTEFSTMKMHALTLSARPAIIYWNGVTLDLIHYVRELRSSGVPVFFTVDAGPQVKVFFPSEMREKVIGVFEGFNGVKDRIISGIGEGVKLIE